MRSTAAKHGLKYDGSARRVTADDLKSFDLVIAMDESNFANLRSMISDPADLGKLHLLREFDTEKGHDLAVPDPYYGGNEGFERTYQIIDRSVKALIQSIIDGTL
jgi:protein-tyrosine phosphatase